MKRLLEVLGFRPSDREAFLARQLDQATLFGAEQRVALARVERLLAFRERMGQTCVDTVSLRAALHGDDPKQPW